MIIERGKGHGLLMTGRSRRKEFVIPISILLSVDGCQRKRRMYNN